MLLSAARGDDLGRTGDLASDLASINPYAIDGDAVRIAFWVNVYNARVLHEFKERPRSGSLLRHRGLFRKVGYDVGGDFFSLDVIEHGVLRRNAKPAHALRRTLGSSDPRLEAAPSAVDPRIHFALNCAATSCPPIRAYEPDGLDEQLDVAARLYLAAETHLDTSARKLTLPSLMKLYAGDFEGRRGHVDYVARYLPEIARQLDSKGQFNGQIKYGDYNWTIAEFDS